MRTKLAVIGAVVVVVALVLAVAPYAYQQRENGKHPRDQAAFVSELGDFECRLAGCHPKGWVVQVKADLDARPEHYIAAGDKACDWLGGHRRFLAAWGWPGGPSAAQMEGAYLDYLLGPDPYPELTPNPGQTEGEIREEVLSAWIAVAAWKHLCGDVLSSRTSWPERAWAPYS